MFCQAKFCDCLAQKFVVLYAVLKMHFLALLLLAASRAYNIGDCLSVCQLFQIATPIVLWWILAKLGTRDLCASTHKTVKF